jgi:hypothetical protein
LCVNPPTPDQPLVELKPRKFAHAQIRLAEDDRAGASKVRCDGRVLRRRRADEGERSRRRLHPVARIDVRLEEDRDSV